MAEDAAEIAYFDARKANDFDALLRGLCGTGDHSPLLFQYLRGATLAPSARSRADTHVRESIEERGKT